MSPLRSVRPDRCRQRAGDRRDRTVERKLAKHAEAVDGVMRDSPDRCHQSERDGQVVMAPLLRQVCRREIDSDTLRRQRKSDRVERAADTFAALGDGLVGETDDREGGEARADLHLDVDGPGLDALKGNGGDPCEHRHPPTGLRQPAGDST